MANVRPTANRLHSETNKNEQTMIHTTMTTKLKSIFAVLALLIGGANNALADTEMCSAYLTATSGSPNFTNCIFSYSGGNVPGGTQSDSYYYSQLNSGYYEIELNNNGYSLFQEGDVITVYLYSNESEVGYKIGIDENTCTEVKLTGRTTGTMIELSHTITSAEIIVERIGNIDYKKKIRIYPYSTNSTKTYFAGFKITTTRVRATENIVYFAKNTIEFRSTGTQPSVDNNNNTKYVQQDLLWQWSGSDEVLNLTKMANDDDFIWAVEVTGDLSIPTEHYYKKDTDGKSYIIDGVNSNSGTKIYFEGNSGTIKVTATNPDYGGRTYSCSYTIYYHMDSQKWDFYTHRLAVGTMTDQSSSLYIHRDDWELQTVASSINGEISESVYMYKNVISDNGNPTSASHLVSETNGLKFYAPAYKFGLYNENNSEGICGDRFIALKPGAKVVIPSSYFSSFSSPRIRIKMGRYGGPDADHPRIDLTIPNGKDALGNAISTAAGAYQIGGSAWRDNEQRGEYHFIPADKTQDFVIEVHAGQWLKLYSIEVYNSTELMTENSVLGDKYQLLNVGGTVGADGVAGTYYLHYRGKGEHSKVYTHNMDNSDGKKWEYWPTGTVTCTNSSFTNYNGGVNHTYTSKKGEFGSFNIRLQCYTIDGNYCTDYASRSQSVGYLAPVAAYPYTWDFTDVNPYKDGPSRMGNAESGTDHYGEHDYVYYDRWEKRAAWDKEDDIYGLRLSKDGSGHNVTYCGGSQLWYGKTIIPELAGLGFSASNYSSSYNHAMEITSSGLKLDQEIRDWWSYRIAVPNVPQNGVLYVRVHPLRTDIFYNAGYSYGDYRKALGNDPGNNEVRFDASNSFNTTDGTNDKVYIVPGTAESYSSNITLYFNGVTIKKIAVSTDPKRVNELGWATESRNHVIDPELTSYMTGQNFTTYLVTGVDYDNNKVTMTPIDNAHLMPAATNNGDSQACIIRNNAGTAVNIVNGGFHLFVPDMHESDDVSGSPRKPVVNTNELGNLLDAQLNSGTVSRVNASNSNLINFAFSYRYYNLDKDFKITGEQLTGDQSFYSIAADGASSSGNQAYLPLDKNELNSGVVAGSRGLTLSFDDDSEAGITAIEVQKNITPMTDVYYNLNGQQLSGKPSHQGLYIVNGKKMYVK